MKISILLIISLFIFSADSKAQICVNHQNNVGINDDFPSAKLSIKSLTNRYMIKNQFTNEIPGLPYIKGLENRLTINSKTTPFGVSNGFTIDSDSLVSAYGFHNNISANGKGEGKIHGLKNSFSGTGMWTWVGVATYLTDTNAGGIYGNDNLIDKTNNTHSCYSYHSSIKVFRGSGGSKANVFGLRSQIVNETNLSSSALDSLNEHSNRFAIFAKVDPALNGYAAYFEGTTYHNGSEFQGSDKSLKREIKSLKNSLDILKQLQPKQYKLKNQAFDSDRLTYGFIAQDVEKVIPNLVMPVIQPGESKAIIHKKEQIITNEDGSKTIIPEEKEQIQSMDGVPLLAVNYNGILPFVVDGIKEQDQKIELNASDITLLLSKMQKLENELKITKEDYKALLQKITHLNQSTGL